MGTGIIICGLNGAGKSMLRKTLAEKLHFHSIDNEDLYFPKTDPNDEEVDQVIKETCIEIGKRYEVEFLEIGTDKDHVHFLIRSVPSYSPVQIVKIVKSITAKEVFARCPKVKKKLWGGNFWSSGYYVAIVSEHGNEEVIANYVKNQGNEYKKLFRNEGMEGQITLLAPG